MAEDKLSISYKDSIHLLGVLALFLFLFFGSMYAGFDIITSSLISILAAAAFFVLVSFLLKYKLLDNNHQVSSQEMILLPVYIVLAVIVSPIIIHSINVEILFKNEIKYLGKSKALSINDMLLAYNDTINSNLFVQKTSINADIATYFNLKPSDPGRLLIEKKLKSKPYEFDFSAKHTSADFKGLLNATKKQYLDATYLKLTRDLPKIKTRNALYTSKINNVFDSWIRLKIYSTLKEADKILADNLTQFQKMIKDQPTEFNFNVPISENLPLEKPFELIKRSNFLVPFMIIILIHLLILWPYLFTSRFGFKRIYDRPKESKGIQL
jgi:hypothetical protein